MKDKNYKYSVVMSKEDEDKIPVMSEETIKKAKEISKKYSTPKITYEQAIKTILDLNKEFDAIEFLSKYINETLHQVEKYENSIWKAIKGIRKEKDSVIASLLSGDSKCSNYDFKTS